MLDPNCYVDTREKAHMRSPGILASSIPYLGQDKMYFGDGATLEISHIGKIISLSSPSQTALQNVLGLSLLKKNLLSISQLIKDDACTFEFSSSNFKIRDQQLQRTGSRQGELYSLDLSKSAEDHWRCLPCWTCTSSAQNIASPQYEVSWCMFDYRNPLFVQAAK